MSEAVAGQIATVTHFVGIIPLLVCIGLALHFGAMASEWWIITIGYAVSWVADSVALGPNRIIAYNCYVMLQSGLIAAVLLPKRAALELVTVYALVGMGSVLLLGPANLFPLHTICWLSLTGVALFRVPGGPLRWALLATFGLGWCGWVWFQMALTFETLGVYQCTRLLGSLLLISAMRRPFPTLPGCGSSPPWRGASSSPPG